MVKRRRTGENSKKKERERGSIYEVLVKVKEKGGRNEITWLGYLYGRRGVAGDAEVCRVSVTVLSRVV